MNQEELKLLNTKFGGLVDEFRTVPVDQFLDEYGLNKQSKNKLSCFFEKIIDISGLEFAMTNLCFKTIHLDSHSNLKESVSLKTFKYYDIFQQSWQSSDLFKIFSDYFFVFIVFKDIEKKVFLNQILIWKMPEKILNGDVKKTWEYVQSLIGNGEIVKYIDDNGRYHTYFPSSTDSPYVHVRPHAQSKKDTYPLPVADRVTGLTEYPKHSFWINRGFILKIIAKGGN